MPDLLLEVGLEEIPARMIAAAEAELARRTVSLLSQQRLLLDEATHTTYSTPRRLAVHVTGLLPAQPDLMEQATGPSWKIGFKDSEPTPAAHAFAKKLGVPVSALEKVNTPKGDYVSAMVHRPGLTASEVLLEHLPREIAALYWAKSMYWRADKPERFVRPLRWLVCLLDDQVVPIEFAGITAGNQSYGHRILNGDRAVTIARPAEYARALESAFVLADVEARRHRIRKALDAATRTVPDAHWREDHGLVDQVTHLTEWPSVLLGSFDPEYLDLPEEVLVTVMRDHQKYFAVEDAQGRLAAHFLAVLNTELDEQGTATVRHGNERVLRARFNDARFFWDYDQKIPLAARVDMLKTVTFQKDLGSYFSKTEINLRTARALAEAVQAKGVQVDTPALEQAALLAKTDLTTELVKEFTELQGVVGGLYARAQGLGETVAQAIYAQYMPASIEDAIPATVEGQLFGLADRITTIVEMFAIGLEPTGSKDPFALRRAASAIVKILADSGLPLTLRELRFIAIEEVKKTRSASGAWRPGSVARFLGERLEFYLRDVRGYAYDVVKAVLAAQAGIGLDTVPDIVARAEALTAVRGSADFLAVSSAFKRIKNILAQAERESKDDLPSVLNHVGGAAASPIALVAPEERQLYDRSLEIVPRVEAMREARDYREAMELIATLRPVVDSFFDRVMVMAPEPELRRNRLALIASVLENFSRIADFSEIVTS